MLTKIVVKADNVSTMHVYAHKTVVTLVSACFYTHMSTTDA